MFNLAFFFEKIQIIDKYSCIKLFEGSGVFFRGKMIAPELLMGRGLLPQRKAKTALAPVRVNVLNSRQ